MLTLLLLLQAASGDIVITGKRLEEAHSACVRGGCTPLRDAQASIALAESRFHAGGYLEAKRLLAAAIARNKNNAASDPKPVAAIYEAYATVALHEGNQEDYKSAVGRQVRTLRDNLPADDHAVVTATTALGDMWLKLGDARQADLVYHATEQDALRDGREVPAMLAGMKRAWLAFAQGRKAEARRKLEELGARPVAQRSGYRTALQVLQLRIAAKDANDAEISELVGAVSQSQADDPTLVWAPKYDLDNAALHSEAAKSRRPGAFEPAVSNYADLASEFDQIQWIDVGFWIRPDGRTAEAEVLRGSNSHPWSDSVLKQVGGRRYTASGAAPNSDGVYKVERFTRSSEYIAPKGSMIRRRVATGSFEVLDLTTPGATPMTAR
ncbi:hypothetical protein [Sphingomonas sp.]|jgi:hypothetical protein|uniref:hypothetical protein n=1 Tax=Sphingomonas sp. TaxID=28214 RepID=UPI0026294505|nr:hypothetical protein [Sphingomonas sp.]MDF2603622.1 hypothetical protein [Sphingomonas sp.]